MLLPIVLLLASSASIQPLDPPVARRPLAVDRSSNHLDAPNGFVRKFGGNERSDEGTLIPSRNCSSQRDCQEPCMSITAYVFGDGEYPRLKYVTDCPNLDVPYQTKRARRSVPDAGSEPRLKQTDLKGSSAVGHKDVTRGDF